MTVPKQSDPALTGNEPETAKAPEAKGPMTTKPSPAKGPAAAAPTAAAASSGKSAAAKPSPAKGPSPAARRRLRNLVVCAILYGAGLAAVWGFSLMGVSTLVVFPVFVLGVLIASLETDSGLWGGALGLAYLLSYDFLFTDPVLELKVLNRTDVVALLIFVAVALIMGVITHRMSRQVQAADRTAAALSRLNRLSAGLFESTTPEEACRFSQEFLAKILKRGVTIVLGEPGPDAPPAARDCYEQRIPTGYGEVGYRGVPEKFLPLGMKGRIFGVVAVDCTAGDLDTASRALITSVVAQTLVAVERNTLKEHREPPEE